MYNCITIIYYNIVENRTNINACIPHEVEYMFIELLFKYADFQIHFSMYNSGYFNFVCIELSIK
jgi:hypothetical protein